MGALFAVFWCMRRKLGGAESLLGGAQGKQSGTGGPLRKTKRGFRYDTCMEYTHGCMIYMWVFISLFMICWIY